MPVAASKLTEEGNLEILFADGQVAQIHATTLYDQLGNPIGGDVPGSGTIAAAAATVSMPLSGCASAAFVLSGTWSGSLVAELSVDGGNTWVSAYVWQPPTPAVTPQVLATVTANGTYVVMPVPGASHVRVRASAWTSGSASVSMRSTVAGALPNCYLHRTLDALGLFGTNPGATTYLGPIDPVDWATEGAVYVASNGGFQLYAWPLLDASYDTRNTADQIELTSGPISSGGNSNTYLRFSFSSLLPCRAITFGLLNTAAGTSFTHIGYELRG